MVTSWACALARKASRVWRQRSALTYPVWRSVHWRCQPRPGTRTSLQHRVQRQAHCGQQRSAAQDVCLHGWQGVGALHSPLALQEPHLEVLVGLQQRVGRALEGPEQQAEDDGPDEQEEVGREVALLRSASEASGFCWSYAVGHGTRCITRRAGRASLTWDCCNLRGEGLAQQRPELQLRGRGAPAPGSCLHNACHTPHKGNAIECRH